MCHIWQCREQSRVKAYSIIICTAGASIFLKAGFRRGLSQHWINFKTSLNPCSHESSIMTAQIAIELEAATVDEQADFIL